MSPIVVLAIVVATQNVDDQATDSMRATAVEALGSEDAVVLREVDDTADAETLRIERLVNAQTAAQIFWLDGTHTRARVRVHVAESNRWTERTIEFAVVDTPTERGRALGFAVTSMLPEETLAANPYRNAKKPADTPDLRTAIRLAAVGHAALASTGTANGYGGSLSGEFFVKPAISARLGFAVWEGMMPKINGRDRASSAALGVCIWPHRPSPDRRIAVGIRMDALAINHYVTSDLMVVPGTPNHFSKWLAGVDALAEIAISVTSAVDIVTSLGIEAALGDTDVLFTVPTDTLMDSHPDTIPILRGTGEMGIRVSF